jgi:hypothetical protein
VKDLPPAIDDILERAMAKAPEDRYPSGTMLAEDVQDVLDGRAPRHRASWTAPLGGQTILAATVDGDVPELELVEDVPAVPRRSRPGRWRSRLGRVALVAIAGAGALHFWTHPEDVGYWQGVGHQAHRLLSALTAPAAPIESTLPPPSPTAEPTAVAAAADEVVRSAEPSPGDPGFDPAHETGDLPADGAPPAIPTDAAAQAEPVAGGSVSSQSPPTPAPIPPAVPHDEGAGTAARPAVAPHQEPPAPAVENEPERPIPAPPPATPARTAEPSRPAPPKATPVGWLSIGFEHHQPSGTLEVWVDGKRVVKEALDSRVTRKLLGFELRAGSVQQTLGLAPGRHEVRVRVRSGDDDKTARASTTFRVGATRRLEVKAPRLWGGLSLEWK